jgi:hypothetical protein
MSWDYCFEEEEGEESACRCCGNVSYGDDRTILSEDGLAMVRRCLELRTLSGPEISDLENALDVAGSLSEDVNDFAFPPSSNSTPQNYNLMPRRLPLPEEDTHDGCTVGCLMIILLFLVGFLGTALALSFLAFKN